MQDNYIYNLIPNLKSYEVFDYCDGPKFYSCLDNAGQIFIVYWVGQCENSDSWVYLKISQQRYLALKNGRITIAKMLSNPEDECIYLVKTLCLPTLTYTASMLDKAEILEDWLPEATDVLNISSASLPETKEW